MDMPKLQNPKFKIQNSPPAPLHTHPLTPDDFLPPVSRWTTLGGAILISAVGAAIVLSGIIRYNVTVNAPAVVRPSGDLRLIQAKRNGTVADIPVSENQTVRQGDVIAVLDDDSLDAQRNQFQGTIQHRQAQLTQVAAQLQLMASQIEAEERSLTQNIAVAESELDRSLRTDQEQQVTVGANLAEAEANLAFARSEAQRYQQLVDSGAVAQLQLEERQAAVQAAEAQLERAKAALNPSRAAVAIAQDRLTQEQARRRATLATLTREQESLLQRQSELESQLLADQQTLQQIELDLEQTVIHAPTDGIIHQLTIRNPNQVVRASDTVGAIAPSNEDLVIRARVLPHDIDRVSEGLAAQMRVSACPYTDFGLLSGQVTGVSPDAIAPEQSNDLGRHSTRLSSTRPYFEVTIQPDTMAMNRGDRTCTLKPGMETDVNIISRQESLLQFILRKARILHVPSSQ